MQKQINTITEKLNERGWNLKYYELPESQPYWWVWAFHYYEKGDNRFVLSFITDPMHYGPKKIVERVAASRHEPEGRLDTDTELVLWFGRGWEDELEKWIAAIEQRFGVGE